MSFLMAALLGLFQGIAEFLPISSSGHLALLQNFFTMEQEQDLLFNVLLHFATLLTVLLVYRKDVWEMILEFFRGIAALFTPAGKRQTETPPPARRMVLLVIVATLPLLAVLPVKSAIEELGNNTIFVGCALLVTGCILFASDRLAKGRKGAHNATVVDALLVGVGQALAVTPGISRSGTTISAGIVRGFERTFAVRFSFIMSLPAVLGATILEVADAVQEGVDFTMLPKYLVGMVIAAVSGYFAIKLVNLLADKGKFGKFSYYCWVVGVITIIATLVG